MLYLISYLIGSIQLSVWLGKTFKGIDLRNHGSGATGATNTFRVLGFEIGLIILFFDVIKGILLPLIFNFLGYKISSDEIVLSGFFVVLGHILPLFSNFRGGKGVATLFGIFCYFNPINTLISLVGFIITLFFSKMVSLSSIVSSFLLPLSFYFLYPTFFSLHIYSFFVPIIIVFTHRTNLKRISKGIEPKISIWF